MVSSSHKNADFYLKRDIKCVEVFFKRRYGFEAKINIDLNKVVCNHRLDKDLKASGFIAKELKKNVKHLDILEGYHE